MFQYGLHQVLTIMTVELRNLGWVENLEFFVVSGRRGRLLRGLPSHEKSLRTTHSKAFFQELAIRGALWTASFFTRCLREGSKPRFFARD